MAVWVGVTAWIIAAMADGCKHGGCTHTHTTRAGLGITIYNGAVGQKVPHCVWERHCENAVCGRMERCRPLSRCVGLHDDHDVT